MDVDLRIVVIDKNPLRAAILRDGLREAGHCEVIHIDDTSDILARVNALTPDVIIIDLESPSRDVLEQMFEVSRTMDRPIAMFVDNSDTSMINAAIDAGVSAYIVDGLRKERIKPILDVTIRRFNAFMKLKEELESTKLQLEDRKAIDRAKAIVMKAKSIPEEQAYAMMRKTAMNENKKIADIARSIITAAELLR
ncbi:ANTAR domain-containing response regulator [Methyloferula stellata]|uniref:ANTAR domain-containing response regulator n=1 Tax=Methyloferula stellata TaxID=876270 RepID=UPI0004799DF3|nr:ANTAR domain-containing protein [Methyloferula stellata]